MADTFTALLRLVLQETGGNQNVWGDINNSSAIDLLEDAIAGREDVDVTLSDQTLMPANGADDPARAAILICSGNPGQDRDVIVPSTSKIYVVTNETSPAFNVTIKTALGAGTVITPGTRTLVFVDATVDDVVPISSPQATETVQGIAEIADQAEVDAGTDDERFVTPLKLATFPAVNQATESVKGIAEIADQAETDLGTDDERFITPLKFETSEQLEQATTGQLGRVIKATQGEVDTGTDADKYVTPETLAAAPTSAAVIFTGFVSSTGVGAQFPAGWSVLRNSIGIYTVTHSLGLADDNDLIIVVTAMGEPPVPVPASSNFIYGTVFNRATNSFQVLLGFPDMGTIGGAEHEDHDWNFIAIDNS
jgi:hypothetical protein